MTVDITYMLDGRSITADALAGKSGHLVMRLALTNNEDVYKRQARTAAPPR